MGIFKKKNTDTSSSVLSESEIQKKLYGEFSERDVHAPFGEREPFKKPAAAPVFSKEVSPEKDAAFDLFSAQKEVLSEPVPSTRQAPAEPKAADQGSRYVSIHHFEKKPVPTVAAPSSTDASSRFRYNRPPENKLAMFQDLLKDVSEKMSDLFKFISDPQQVALRRVFYWSAAILVVFLLFWGVNALNSQREEAMRARYKIPGEPVRVVKTPAAAAVVVAPKPVAERPVVITPAPVKPKKVRAAEGNTAVAAPSSGSYVIQVVTYPTRQDADQVVATFKNAGLHAFVKENARPSGRLFYLVLLGGFRTEAEAQTQLLKFRAKEFARPFQDAFVRANRS